MAGTPSPRRISVREIAKAANVSKSTVGYVLQNRTRVSPATRARVLQVARKLGYVPNASMATAQAAWMSAVRSAGNKGLLPIAWLNSHGERDSWSKYLFNTPYIEGARARALELGFRIEEIWTREPGLTMRRLAQVLTNRGIEGVIAPLDARHLRLDWSRLAAVAIGSSLLAPMLHQVDLDLYYNLHLALRTLKRLGYRRIGICLVDKSDSYTHQAIGARAALEFSLASPQNRVPPLFFSRSAPPSPSWAAAKRKSREWLKKHRPEVIVCLSDWMVECVEAEGFRVPDEIGVVHLCTDDDVSDWAGICGHRRQVGQAAVELVTSMIQRRDFGVPEFPRHIQIRGTWSPGRTLLTPCPRREESRALRSRGPKNGG